MSVITSRITYLTISILLLVAVYSTAVGKAEELTQDTTWSGTHVLADTVVVPAGICLGKDRPGNPGPIAARCRGTPGRFRSGYDLR